MKPVSSVAARALLVLLMASPLTLLSSATAQTPLHQEPYKDFYDQLSRFYDKKERDRLTLRTTLRPTGGDRLEEPVRIRLATKEGVTDIAVTAEDYEFQLPYDYELVSQGAVVEINQPEKSFNVRVQIGMKLPEADSFPYAEIVAAFEQFNKLIDKEAGVLSFVAPSARAVRFHCGTDCRVTLAGSSGDRIFTADGEGRVTIPNDKKLRRENPTVQVSKPVSYTVLTTKG